jgi:hypothetical protein
MMAFERKEGEGTVVISSKHIRFVFLNVLTN